MSEKNKNLLILFLYFIVAIVFVGSSGLWLPIAIDLFDGDKISHEVYTGLAGNIITYSLGLFLVAMLDRTIYLLFRTSTYSNNVLEFFAIIFVLIVTLVIVYFSLKYIKDQLYMKAIRYAFALAILGWFSWVYVKIRGSKSNNYSPLGGAIT